jgi:hypothetical protein
MLDQLSPSGNWFERIQLDVLEDEDGSCTLVFQWDEKDPILRFWTELGEKKQHEFILTALENSLRTSDRQDKELCSEE